jgi:hypothetical protein
MDGESGLDARVTPAGFTVTLCALGAAASSVMLLDVTETPLGGFLHTKRRARSVMLSSAALLAPSASMQLWGH